MRCLLTFVIMFAISSSVGASQETSQQALAKLSQQAQPLPLTVVFEQRKYLAGLPRALVSSGEIAIKEDEILWQTQKPQTQTLRITEQGIVKGSEKTSAPGSEAIAELLLAILKQDQAVLQQQFNLSLHENCVQMTPNSEVVGNVMQRILSCGDGRVERVELHETNGNKTEIDFAEATQ